MRQDSAAVGLRRYRDQPMPLFRNLIGGEWRDADDASVNRSPSDIDDVIGTYARADVAQVEDAIAAASAALPSWATASILQRAEILDRAG